MLTLGPDMTLGDVVEKVAYPKYSSLLVHGAKAILDWSYENLGLW
jgi:hypothetical protein